MRTIWMLALASAVVALGAMTAASASAEEFVASKTGKVAGHALSLQKIAVGAHFAVECEEASASGEMPETSVSELKLAFKYGSCFAPGIGKATIAEAKYALFLPPLLSVASKSISIKAEAFGVTCAVSVTVGQSVGNHSGELEYENKSGTLEVKAKIAKITTEITESNSEALCGKAGEKPEASYTGNEKLELEGGTLETGAGGGGSKEFIYSGAGKITGKALNTWEYKTGGDPTVKCTEVTPSGEVEAGKLKFTEIKISLAYNKCSVIFGSATVTLADYTFFAPPGMSILGTAIKIHAEAIGVKCTISVASGQMLGKAAGEIEYVNKAGKVEEKNKVKGIASEITESNSTSLCGTAGEKLTGEYTGNMEMELEGGTIEVK